MYPRLSDIFQDLFGISLPFPIYSFGAMVAVGVLTGMWLMRKEFDRLYEAGRVGSVRVPVEKKGRSVMKDASPSVLVGTITVMAVVLGIAGAKLFHILDYWDRFTGDPLGMIFSSGGLTFYGGLIIAAVGISWYVRKKGVPLGAFFDVGSPGLLIAYGIGRIGCHLAGDGDWGIAADMSAKPGWLPTWLWAETYPNNILNMDLPSPGVYPTSIYEFLAAVALFGILWSVRKHPFLNGWLFSLYLVFIGTERFLIEVIRVNNTYDFLGVALSQAQAISVLIVAAGIVGLVLTSKRRKAEEAAPSEIASAVLQ